MAPTGEHKNQGQEWTGTNMTAVVFCLYMSWVQRLVELDKAPGLLALARAKVCVEWDELVCSTWIWGVSGRVGL